jgi:hypothetical protein
MIIKSPSKIAARFNTLFRNCTEEQSDAVAAAVDIIADALARDNRTFDRERFRVAALSLAD